MKEVNLKFAPKDIEGQELKEIQPVNKFIGNFLLQGSHDDSLKVMGWALQLGKSGKLLLDNSDFEKFKKIIETDKKLPVLYKAPTEQALIDAKEVKEK